ncbi:hypothetical protein JCM16303_002875 [Sporobolomyces ruberrimus]
MLADPLSHSTDERLGYPREADDASFDWFKTYAEIQDLVNRFVPSKSARIVMLGCGNSTLSKDLASDGYSDILNLDYSSVVIDKMKRLHEKEWPEMTWIVGDIRKLPFEDQSIDVCIDKGTMDALMTGVDDVWNPQPEIVADVKAEVDEVIRVLKPSGTFLYLTFGQPHFRRQHLTRPGWKLEICEVGEGFSYYFYILRREDQPAL